MWEGLSQPNIVSGVLPRRKEFVVQDLQEEIRKLKLRIDLLTKERDALREKLIEAYSEALPDDK